MAPAAAESPFESLSTFGSLFSALSALFGAYFVVFVLAVWATYQHEGPAQKRLRWVTLSLFVVLLIHYIARALTFGQTRIMAQPLNEESMWSVPLMFVNDLTSTIAGTISDGLLAWRFYVVFGRSQWALYAPTAAVFFNAALGISGNFMYLAFYHSSAEYDDHFKLLAFQIYTAWAWCMLGVNTILTGLVIWRIVRISRGAKSSMGVTMRTPRPYNIAIEAIAESSMITWIGLVVYGISSVAPQGRITTHWDVGFIMSCILPMFFGLSQCLITARLGFANAAEVSRPNGDSSGHVPCNCVEAGRIAKSIAIMVRQETEMDAVTIASDNRSPKDDKTECIA